MDLRIIFIFALFVCQSAVFASSAQEAEVTDVAVEEPTPASEENPKAAAADSVPAKKALPVVHPPEGEELSFGQGVKIRLEKKLQNYTYSGDPDIYSPKSVNVHPSGKKFYINSLEGGKTVVYSLPEGKKLAVISHQFGPEHSKLWAPESGLFKFRHYSEGLNSFMGKPVESTFSHGGRYLWVPYYRRSFDLNAQDPSALAVIDTRSDSIIRLMETGVLPKMITTSPDGRTIAVTHWGDNTVSLIDIASERPEDWHYTGTVAVGRQLFHDYSLTQSVDRDSNSGEALRGTVFTPDGRYLLVGCMSGGGGIAVIDVAARRYLGKIHGGLYNVRHLAVKEPYLYASINAAGIVKRAKIQDIMQSIGELETASTVNGPKWQSVQVAPGARTIALSPEGDYIFAACNTQSLICIVDSSMQKVGEIPVDSYPVGLAISPDGQWLISTSQGRHNLGGNCVDLFRIEGLKTPTPEPTKANPTPTPPTTQSTTQSTTLKPLLITLPVILLILLTLPLLHRRKK